MALGIHLHGRKKCWTDASFSLRMSIGAAYSLIPGLINYYTFISLIFSSQYHVRHSGANMGVVEQGHNLQSQFSDFQEHIGIYLGECPCVESVAPPTDLFLHLCSSAHTVGSLSCPVTHVSTFSSSSLSAFAL